jgi:hypothetical protein
MRPRDPRASARGLTVSAIVVVLVAACGGATASSTPAPSAAPSVAPATPVPTPSPTPADVSAAFVQAVSAPDLKAEATLTGTVTISGLEGTITGDAVRSGDASQSSNTIAIGGTKQTTESIEEGPSSPGGAGSWTKHDDGPWVVQEVSTQPDLFETIAGLSGIEDVGIVVKDGKPLHHLRPKAGTEISPGALGFDVEGAKDPAFTMDFYATDDGTPAVIAINGSWTQASGDTDVPVDVDVEYALSEPSTPPSIVPPTQPWILNTSKALGYEMAHPEPWTVESAKGQDAYLLDGQPFVFVAPQKVDASMTVAKFADALKKVYKPKFGKPTTEAATRLGGQVGKRLIFEFTNDAGQDVTLVDDVTVRDGMGWEVFVATTGGQDDIPIFDQFVSTFAFTD